jgi:hypothetical protein
MMFRFPAVIVMTFSHDFEESQTEYYGERVDPAIAVALVEERLFDNLYITEKDASEQPLTKVLYDGYMSRAIEERIRQKELNALDVLDRRGYRL